MKALHMRLGRALAGDDHRHSLTLQQVEYFGGALAVQRDVDGEGSVGECADFGEGLRQVFQAHGASGNHPQPTCVGDGRRQGGTTGGPTHARLYDWILDPEQAGQRGLQRHRSRLVLF
ncbi:hypothetical protein D3C85_974100 [compost metagenome]